MDELKAKISKELGLQEQVEENFLFDTSTEERDFMQTVDMENRYSANSAMENAAGYENLTERMANPD